VLTIREEVWLPELLGGEGEGVVIGEGSSVIGEVGGEHESGVEWLLGGWRFSSRGISFSKICIIC
jgi:hypothetical protein